MSDTLICLFSDFGFQGPYLGQMETVLYRSCPGVKIINLMCDAPVANPRAAAYLLSALDGYLPDRVVVVAVVDPGVGSSRKGLCLKLGDHWYVGPDNGLLAVLASKSHAPPFLGEIPKRFFDGASQSFHGRDVFSPVAAVIARDWCLPGLQSMEINDMIGSDWPQELAEIIYFDGFGNAMTGLSADSLAGFRCLQIGGLSILPAATFSSVSAGALFCYKNSLGLVEISANSSSAKDVLGLSIGQAVEFCF